MKGLSFTFYFDSSQGQDTRVKFPITHVINFTLNGLPLCRFELVTIECQLINNLLFIILTTGLFSSICKKDTPSTISNYAKLSFTLHVIA